MRICKIWDGDYPWDVRVEKVATALAGAGHEMHLVCRNQARRQRREWDQGFMIHRLQALPAVFGPANTLWNFPYPFNPAWIRVITQVIRETKADLILVRDLPMALPAAIIGKAFGIPVVLDMAENYPAMLRDRLRYVPTGLLGRLVRSPALARFVERVTVRLVDHILVVIEESRERLIQLGVPPGRLTVVRNTPKLDQVRVVRDLSFAPDTEAGTTLVYLGNLDGGRGLDVVIRAVRLLADGGVLTRLLIIGDGPDMQQYRDLASRLAVSAQVIFQGRSPLSTALAMVARCDIGVIPQYVTAHTDSTVSNKLFDYMLAGLPVIASSARPTARIVGSEACGEIFLDRDVADLERCIRLLQDPQRRRDKGLRGQAAVHERYNWSCDSRILVQTLEEVGSCRKPAKAGGPSRSHHSS